LHNVAGINASLYLAIQSHRHQPTQRIAMPAQQSFGCLLITLLDKIKQLLRLFRFGPHFHGPIIAGRGLFRYADAGVSHGST
jgi:hypothetical protein